MPQFTHRFVGAVTVCRECFEPMQAGERSTRAKYWNKTSNSSYYRVYHFACWLQMQVKYWNDKQYIPKPRGISTPKYTGETLRLRNTLKVRYSYWLKKKNALVGEGVFEGDETWHKVENKLDGIRSLMSEAGGVPRGWEA